MLAPVAALPGEVGRRAVVLLTDGLDEHSQLGVELVDEALERARVALYPIHVEGGHLDPRELTMARAFLEVRARRSGGAYCFARDGSAIESCLRDIAAELRSTYLAVVRLREGEDGRDAGLELARGAGARLRVP